MLQAPNEILAKVKQYMALAEQATSEEICSAWLELAERRLRMIPPDYRPSANTPEESFEQEAQDRSTGQQRSTSKN
jgi:hypothetical protein